MMRRCVCLMLPCALVLAACAPPAAHAPAPSPDDIVAEQSRVAAVLDDWHDAAARADEARYFAHFAPYAVFLGTDATERWNVDAFRAYAHPHFAAGKAWRFRAVRRSLTIAGDVAWFDEDLATEKLGPARGSGVLVRREGEWRIVQYDLSIPIPNDRFPAVRAIIAEGEAPPPPPPPPPPRP